MTQQDLFVERQVGNYLRFDPVQSVRRNDPQTAAEAVVRVASHVSELQERIVAELRAGGPRTAKELEQLEAFAGCSPSTVRKRVSELWHRGVIVDTGNKRDGCTEYGLPT